MLELLVDINFKCSFLSHDHDTEVELTRASLPGLLEVCRVSEKTIRGNGSVRRVSPASEFPDMLYTANRVYQVHI